MIDGRRIVVGADQGFGLEEAAFRALIVAEIDAVFRLGCYLTRSRQEADDVVQETYLRALRSSTTFVLGEHGVRPWLFKILHNVIISRGAKLQREREVMHSLHDERHAETSGAGAATLATQPIDWDGVDERLKAAVAQLQVAYRATFLLSAVEGLTYREIADVTDVPIGTVMSRLSRARSTLAAALSGLAAEQRLVHASQTRRPETPPTI